MIKSYIFGLFLIILINSYFPQDIQHNQSRIVPADEADQLRYEICPKETPTTNKDLIHFCRNVY